MADLSREDIEIALLNAVKKLELDKKMENIAESTVRSGKVDDHIENKIEESFGSKGRTLISVLAVTIPVALYGIISFVETKYAMTEVISGYRSVQEHIQDLEYQNSVSKGMISQIESLQKKINGLQDDIEKIKNMKK